MTVESLKDSVIPELYFEWFQIWDVTLNSGELEDFLSFFQNAIKLEFFTADFLKRKLTDYIYILIFLSVEAAGGKALPCIVNVREEDQIADAVVLAVQKFGGNGLCSVLKYILNVHVY